jgi:hypothetical protein
VSWGNKIGGYKIGFALKKTVNCQKIRIRKMDKIIFLVINFNLILPNIMINLKSMWKKVLLICLFSLFLSGCSFSTKKTSIEIVTNPSAKIYINGKNEGNAPYKGNNIKPGEIDLRLEYKEIVVNKKIKLKDGLGSVVYWDFGKNEEESGGYVLSMEKTGDKKMVGLIVSSIPTKSILSVDDETIDYTPKKIDSLGEGDKKITLSFPSYKSSNIFVKGISGYQFIIEAKLAKEEIIETPNIEPTPTSLAEKKMVTIKETETGWLRVRESSSSASTEIDKVNPGESFELIEKNVDWVKIKLNDDKSGWVSATYVDIN